MILMHVGGVEFRVCHRFRSREEMLHGMKNYNIRRSAKYRVIESDWLKYHVHCRKFTEGRCVNLVDYTHVWPPPCHRITNNDLISRIILPFIQSSPSVAISVL
ncbi:hypothetical protein Ahy_A10g047536 [Arachis hypogaea]|uniref:Uncharacterized protein n=1 Tax=Arachis hypogaea TaxID=3818 RepID=A0A445B2U7_ARAHY|nr:hypothetical protein Ahy_A10g047536 [Arachis hypogaea]